MTATSPPGSGESIVPAIEAWRALLHDWSSSRDYSTLVRLSRRIEKLACDPGTASRLVPIRLAVLSSATVDFLLPILNAALYAAGFKPTLYVAPYGQVATAMLSDTAPLVQFQPQVTVVFHATPHLPGYPNITDSLTAVTEHVTEVCRSLLHPCVVFHDRTGSEVVINNFHPLPGRAAGNLGAKLPADSTTFIRRLNLALGDCAPVYVHIHDIASLAEHRGLDTWIDLRYWYLAKQPVSFACVSDYCRSLVAVIGAIFGRTKKCLVLDLDNTLWGGTIGDDGLAGIQIGEGTAEGEAFKAFQLYLRRLKQRGVLLAVCSKNDEGIARSAFTDHPDMVLGLDDFVAFKVNWRRKSENIVAIANEINLPLESLVFVDDNPAERDEVARALPNVTVPELPDDPAGFLRWLDREWLFEAATLTGEDFRRTSIYHARRETQQGLADATDIREYLASLQMRATIRPFEPISFDRITQLVNKTNQFNLTTPRLLTAEIERLSADPAALTCSVRLHDRFGDHGLVSVLFGRFDGAHLIVDAWLMSCRVMGRGLEHLLFNHVVAVAQSRGLGAIVGYYKPTDRNILVKDHYLTLGFSLDSEAGGVQQWCLRLEEAKAFDTFITLEAEHLPR